VKPLLLALVLAATPAPQDLKLEPNGSLRHPSSVQGVALTPDSRKAFVALNDGTLLAFALETRKPLEVGFRAFGSLNALAVNGRGDRLAVVDGNGYVTLLDTDSLKVATKAQFKADPENVVFAPDGKSLFVAFSDGHLLKLKASDLKTEVDIFPTEGSRVLALACAGDGKTVATADRDGQIKLWSAAALKLQKVWKAHDRMARSLAFDPSGHFLLSGGEEGALKVWKLSDSSLVKESREYHQESITAIAFAPGGRLVTGGYDGLCQFWDGVDLKPGRSFPNYRGYVTAGAVSADGRWLVRGGSSVDFVPLDRPEAFERVADYGGAILGLAVAADMKRFATGSLDRRLIVWQVDKGITSQAALLEDWVTAVAYCRGDRSVAAGLANGKIDLRAAGTLQREQAWAAHQGRVVALASVEGKLVSIGDDGAVHVWGLDGKRLKTFDEKAPCRALAVRGSRVAVGTANGTVSVYDLATNALVKRLQVRPQSVTALGISRAGSVLLVGYFDGGLESFDTTTWAVKQYRPGKGESVLAIEASLKVALFAVGFRDGYARLYEVISLQEGAAVQTRPAREIFAIRWVFEDNSFAMAGASHSIIFQRIKGNIEAWVKKVR
jgi:WD40 repeat protein